MTHMNPTSLKMGNFPCRLCFLVNYLVRIKRGHNETFEMSLKTDTIPVGRWGTGQAATFTAPESEPGQSGAASASGRTGSG